MKELNQIIIEGKVVQEIPENVNGMGILEINNNEKLVVPVLCCGEMLTNQVKSYGRKNREVRIVGKLVEHEGKLVISAEYVEFKPMPKAKVTD